MKVSKIFTCNTCLSSNLSLKNLLLSSYLYFYRLVLKAKSETYLNRRVGNLNISKVDSSISRRAAPFVWSRERIKNSNGGVHVSTRFFSPGLT